MKRQSVFFLTTTILLGTALLFTSAFIYFKLQNLCKEEKICLTPECVQAAAKILTFLNTSVNPCENFYEFSCGNFLDAVEIPVDRNYVDTETIMHEELLRQLKELLEESSKDEELLGYMEVVKNYYRACNNVNGIEKQGLTYLWTILYELGGWPVLEGFSWNERNFHWYQYAYRLNNFGVDTNFFVTLTVAPHESNGFNNNKYIIKVDVPDLSLLKNALLLPNLSGKFFYHRFMVSVAKYMGANESRAVYELTQSLEFETNLAHISLIRDEEPQYMTITELEKQFRGIPWFDYINNFASSQFVITRDERVAVLCPRYLVDLNILLNRTPARVQANYIIWRTISSLIPYLNEDLREREHAYKNAINRYSDKQPRWLECISETYNRLPILVSSMYVEKHFDIESKAKATTLYQWIKKEYIDLIETIEWMDETSKRRTIDRVSGMTYFVGYSDEILRSRTLEAVYSKLTVDPEDYLQSLFNIKLFEHKQSVRKLRESPIVDGLDEAKFVADTAILYDQQNNHFLLSAGALQGFLFNKRLPNYLNYGGIGFRIAKEMTRIFDQHTYNRDHFYNQWQPETENSYLEKVQCFIRQYNNYAWKEIYEPINETISATKIISDNVGLKVAYLSYQKLLESYGEERKLAALEYTPNQLFWISYGISQCTKEKPKYLKSLLKEYGDVPAEVRVTETLSNLEYFSKDFQCEIASPMNPPTKCGII